MHIVATIEKSYPQKLLYALVFRSLVNTINHRSYLNIKKVCTFFAKILNL